MLKFNRFFFFLVILFSIKANGQNNACFIKYGSFKTNTKFYNHWFVKENLFYTVESNFGEVYKTFPVFDDKGNSRTETDTIMYRQEYNEHINFMKSSIQPFIAVNKRNFTSNIQFRFHPARNGFDKLIVVDTLKHLNDWNISDDTLTILNFKCQKATIIHDGDLFIAWFTTGLPFNAGPEKFRGLPGLILKVSNKEESLGFEALEIKYPYKESIPKFDEACKNIISMKEFLKQLDERNKKNTSSTQNIINAQNEKKEN
jgi:GLPGLI family protein